MRRFSSLTIAGLVLASLASLAAVPIAQGRQEATAANPQAKDLENPVAAAAESIAAGRQTFRKFCVSCHGVDAKGDGPTAPKNSHPPNLTDDVWIHGPSDGEIFTVIKEGAGPKSEMKAFKSKLTAQEMWNVVNYLRSLAEPH